MAFSTFGFDPRILQALVEEGYVQATPIQAQAIPHALAGKDVLGCAQTGTGKTAAFALPMLHRLASSPQPGQRLPRALVLCPTRELATQIAQAISLYGRHLKVRTTTVFGGVPQHRQAMALRHGVDVLVATPGRLQDLMEQGLVNLGQVEAFILDEADRMLDMGFVHAIREVAKALPAQRQTMLFSATMPDAIRKLAGALLKLPVQVHIAAATPTAEGVEQGVYHVDHGDKPALLAHVLTSGDKKRAIVFTRTKHGADRLVSQLARRGIQAEAIHGDKAQRHRERALASFKADRTSVLVATDVASRGIDVEDVTHVVNYDLTHEPETYVHRIGRTARAGAAGIALSFCARSELPHLRAIERMLKRQIPVKADHPAYPAGEAAADRAAHPDRPQRAWAAERPAFGGSGPGGRPGRRPGRSR